MAAEASQAHSHRAVFIDKHGQLSAKEIKTLYTPGESQTLIRVKYSAINPADIRHCYMGLYDNTSVTGYEWTGTVVDVGKSSGFSIGQDLFGVSMAQSQRPVSAGAHQDFLLAEGSMTWPLPVALAQKQAVSLPVGLQTAADALFNVLGFSFPPSRIGGALATQVPILIWGGASTCGLAAIQIAKAAGFGPIFTTASVRHHATLQELGATACFDYHRASVVEDIQLAVNQSGKKLSTVFDAVGVGLGVWEAPSEKPVDLTKSTPSLARKCCSNVPEEELRLCSVLRVANDSTWRFCLGTRSSGTDTMGIPQDPSWPARVETFMQWFLANPKSFLMPNVTVVSGIEVGMRQIQRVFDGGVSMEKVVIAHPWG